MKRTLSSSLLLFSLVAAAAANFITRPNILFLLSDDQRPDTVAALGNKHIHTPHIDGLVKKGFVFNNTYCMGSMSGAVCAPSRAMLLTGRTLWHNPPGFNVPWKGPKDQQGKTPHITMPEHFRAMGFETFGTGKWHQGEGSFAKGFTHGGHIFFGGMGSHTTLAVHDFADVGKGKAAGKSHNRFSSALFADAAIGYLAERAITRKKDYKPFFMYVSFTAPHDPRTPPEDVLAQYDPAKLPLPANYLPEHPFDNGELRIRDEKLAPFPRTEQRVREELAKYYAMITHMDTQVGRILSALDETGEAGNTIVVFTSDHGLGIGSHGLMGKQNLYEHSMKAPLVFAGKNVPQGSSDALVYLYDLFPTLAQMAITPPPESVEGKALFDIMLGKQKVVRDHVFTAYRNIHRAVRDDRWKLIEYRVKGKATRQVFDLANDPHELKNLAGSPEVAKTLQRLRTLLHSAQAAVDDPDQKHFR